MADRAERFLAALRGRVAEGAEILDFGCGSGEITVALSAAGWRMTGADPSGAMVDTARRHRKAIEWVRLDSPDGVLPFSSGRFAAVIASSVLEYVAVPERVLEEVARVLAPGGWLCATVPDMTHPARMAEAAKRRRALNPLLFALLRLTPWRSTYEYLRLSINRMALGEWTNLLRIAGLSPEIPESGVHPLALLIAQRRSAGA